MDSYFFSFGMNGLYVGFAPINLENRFECARRHNLDRSAARMLDALNIISKNIGCKTGVHCGQRSIILEAESNIPVSRTSPGL